jgi:hypothetical protein
MNYSMTTPCDQCPFLISSGFTYGQLVRHASGEFACHKTCKIEEDKDGCDVFVPRNKDTPHCAGALIFLEKQNKPHQMMRIYERLGFYDRRKLDMKAKVGSQPRHYRKEN